MLGGVAILITRGTIGRTMLAGLIAGLYLFSGIGAFAPEVTPLYIRSVLGYCYISTDISRIPTS